MIEAVLFDKDGVLFDFQKTWGAWAAEVLRDLSEGNASLAETMARAILFDLDSWQFDPASPVVAGTADVAPRLIHGHIPHWDFDELQDYLDDRAAGAKQVEPVPLAPLMDALRVRGLRLGVATNDAESNARANLASVGAEDAFDMIMGYDSGFGAKPDPGMQFAFADQVGVAPAHIVMVGDSTHDMEAGKAAGMRRVAVLTGPATQNELAPHAEAVLESIAGLPGWIDADRAR